MPKHISKEKEQAIITKYKEKPITFEQLATIFHISIPTAQKIIKKYRITPWKKNQLFSPDLKENYFENIDSDEKAYFVGLLTTDGCVFWKNHKHAFISIELKATDKYILEQLMESVCCNRKLVYNKRSNTYTATITSSKMVKDLEQYNIKPKSSSTQELATNIPSEYFAGYMRGILDGDGSYGFYARPKRKSHSKSIRLSSGNRLFLEQWINATSAQLQIAPVSIYASQSDRSYTIEYKRNNDLETIIEYVYAPNGPHLLRKKEIANKILTEIRQYRDNRNNATS